MIEKKKRKGSAGLIASMVAIVVFVALLPLVKQATRDTDTLTTYTNESVAFVSGAGTIATPEIYSITSIMNRTTSLNATSNYNTTNSGTGAITIGGSGIITTGTFNVTYVRNAPGYLTDSSARAVSGQIFLFVILGLLVFTVMAFGLVGM